MSLKEEFTKLYGSDKWSKFRNLAKQFEDEFFNEDFEERELLYNALLIGGVKIDRTGFERLEFLGDSLLQSIIGYELYINDDLKKVNPGDLTKYRIEIVKNENWARIMSSFDFIQDLGSLFNLGEVSQNNLADLFEALVGAYFLEKGEDEGFKKTRAFVRKITRIKDYINEIQQRPWGNQDPLSFLYEIVRKRNWTLDKGVSENVGTQNSPLHKVHWVLKNSKDNVIADFISDSFPKKKEAERDVAKKILLKIGENGLLD